MRRCSVSDPGRIGGHGVRGEILQIAAEHREALGFEPTVNIEGPADDLGQDVLEQLLPSIREALTNAGKYAHATSVSVDAAVTPTDVTVVVADDGVGLDMTIPGSSVSLAGHGMGNLAARAEKLDGTLAVDAAPGAGCTVTWRVPRDG